MNSVGEVKPTRRRRARNPEEKQQQLIALAVDRVEQRIRDGEASSAELLYILKMASPQYQQEMINLKLQGELLQAKRDEIMNNQKGNADYDAAMKALTGYLPTREEDIIDADFREH